MLRHILFGSSHVRACWTIVLVITAGCASEMVDGPMPQEGSEVQASVEGLRLGDYGPEVRFVHDYLAQYGYMPNDALAARYPGWRPLLPERPADPDRFDELLERAVKGFQEYAQLPAHGVVDAATLAIMHEARCSHPESFPQPDEKFRFLVEQHGKDSCTPRVVNGFWEITFSSAETDPQFSNTFLSALSEWSRLTGIRFRQVSSNACIRYEGHRRLNSTDCNGINADNLAFNCTHTDPPDNRTTWNQLVVGSQRTNGTTIPWSFNTPAESDKYSLRVNMLHELGHALGLQHSSHQAMWGEIPVMFFVASMGERKSALTDDDVLAVHFPWPSRALHLRSDGTGNGTTSMDVTLAGDLWTIDPRAANSTASGGALWCNGVRRNGEGLFVAAEYDRAWHVNSAGDVFRGQPGSCNTGWQRISSDSPLSFIAANNQGHVWALGRDPQRNQQERFIFRFDGTRFRRMDGFATRIAVDTNGVPYHVNQAKELYVWDASRSGCALSNPSSTAQCWRRHSTGWVNVHGGKNSFVWMISSNTKSPFVLNTNLVAGNVDCSSPSSTCTVQESFKSFPYQNQSDAVSDGLSRVYIPEGLIPTDGGPAFNSGELYSNF